MASVTLQAVTTRPWFLPLIVSLVALPLSLHIPVTESREVSVVLWFEHLLLSREMSTEFFRAALSLFVIGTLWLLACFSALIGNARSKGAPRLPQLFFLFSFPFLAALFSGSVYLAEAFFLLLVLPGVLGFVQQWTQEPKRAQQHLSLAWLALGGVAICGGYQSLFSALVACCFTIACGRPGLLHRFFVNWRVSLVLTPLCALSYSGLDSLWLPFSGLQYSFDAFVLNMLSIFNWSAPWGWVVLALGVREVFSPRRQVVFAPHSGERLLALWVLGLFISNVLFSRVAHEASLLLAPPIALLAAHLLPGWLCHFSDQLRSGFSRAFESVALVLVLFVLMAVLCVGAVASIPEGPTQFSSEIAQHLRKWDLKRVVVFCWLFSAACFSFLLCHKRFFAILSGLLLTLFGVAAIQILQTRIPGYGEFAQAVHHHSNRGKLYLWEKQESDLFTVLAFYLQPKGSRLSFPDFPPRCDSSVIVRQEEAQDLLARIRLRRVEEIKVVLYHLRRDAFRENAGELLALIDFPSCSSDEFPYELVPEDDPLLVINLLHGSEEGVFLKPVSS